MRFCLLVGLAVLALGRQSDVHPVQRKIVDRVNQKNLTWKAQEPEKNPLGRLSINELQGLMGLKDMPVISRSSLRSSHSTAASLPSRFDAREQWPQCQKPVLDQMSCGSCWAFAAAETLTDNLCVLGLDPPLLSPQHLISCDITNRGCQGGYLDHVWEYIDGHGIVSDECMPYTSGDGSSASCPKNGCTSSIAATSYKCPVAHSFLNTNAQIQGAVVTTGAVEVGYSVYEDFMNYLSGVYKYSEGTLLGGHAVKVVGWGNDASNPFYWIVQNSWGSAWGENGMFRIVNWEADGHYSAFARGGGYACVDGESPSPSPVESPPYYGAPPCRTDETAVSVQGYSGVFCSPSCTISVCPTDVPAGATATPMCGAFDSTGNYHCALVCMAGGGDTCPTGSVCQSDEFLGVCMYPSTTDVGVTIATAREVQVQV